jgi:hypothetical protein
VIPLAPSPTFAPASPFAAPRPAGEPRPQAGPGAPPAGRCAWRAAARRKARLQRAKDALGTLPGPGEATHWLLESYYDPLDITEAIIRGHGGPCERLRLATLSFSARNVRHLRGLMDEGAVRGLTLLCSDWMADANPKVYDLARADLADQRGATLARARCHAKVAVIDLAGGARFVIEGSGNTSSCRTIEQLMCANDAGLAEWHAGWIDRLAAR